MGGLSMSHEHQIWDHAIWGKGCQLILDDNLNATSELDDPVMPEWFSTNMSRSEAPRGVMEARTADDSFTDMTTASTDKGIVIV